jgi:hypothetical protein
MAEHTDLSERHPGVDLARHDFFDTGHIGSHKKKKLHVGSVFPEGPAVDHDVIAGETVPEVRVQDEAANDYDAGTVTVARAADSEVVQLLPRDTQRTRALLVNNGASAVLVGKLSSGLGQGNGFTLAANGGSVEILTTQRVFGCVVSSASANTTCAVSVWSERDR